MGIHITHMGIHLLLKREIPEKHKWKYQLQEVAGEFRKFISSSIVVPMYRSKDSLNDSVNKTGKRTRFISMVQKENIYKVFDPQTW